MTLDEAIEREEALTYSFGERYKRLGEPVGELDKLEAEHRQLAEWLRTLKAYGEARKAIEGTIEELKKSGDDTYIKGLELAEQIIHELVDEEEYEWDTQ